MWERVWSRCYRRLRWCRRVHCRNSQLWWKCYLYQQEGSSITDIICLQIKTFLNHCKSGGSFSCSCNTGFFGITGTVGSCGDLDECLSSWNECPDSAECTNTVGSYECDCGEGRIRNIIATFWILQYIVWIIQYDISVNISVKRLWTEYLRWCSDMWQC